MGSLLQQVSVTFPPCGSKADAASEDHSFGPYLCINLYRFI